jgi:uncharacterized protein (TIGR03437 family)
MPLLDGTVVSNSDFRSALVPVSALNDPLGSSPGTSLEVLYAGGAPGMVLGVMQVNFQLPESFPPLSSVSFRFALQIGATIGGVASIAVGQ